MIDKPIFPLGVKRKANGLAAEPGVPEVSKDSPILGLALCAKPAKLGELDGSNQIVELNFTGPPGSASGIYFSLIPFLEKNGFKVVKVDEWISVTPEHQQYYQIVTEQKRQLEGVIKTGLASAAQAVADASLVEHDLRKYMEILDYFKEDKRGDEHSLRAMFIDQIDVHTGDGVSLRSIVQRWPTIIADFMRLSSGDDTIEKVEKRLKGISKAEAVILTTKNKLYIEWKKIFQQASVNRYDQLKALSESRKKTVEEYRNWLKPYIARFKAMKLGHENIAGILESAKSAYELAGQASFSNGIKLWAWKPFMPTEFRKPSIETGYEIPIADEFAVNNFIKNKDVGLANKDYFPQLNNPGKEPERTVADDLIKEILDKWDDSNKLNKNSHYYIFFEIDVFRTGGKIHAFEFEDITFTVKTYMISQNVMLVKMLELRLRELEIEKYINQILGLQEKSAVETEYPELAGKKEGEKESAIKIGFGFEKYKESSGKFFKETGKFFGGIGKGMENVFSGLGLPLMFAKRGPYVRDFADTIIKFFLMPMGTDYFGPLKGFIMEQMKID